MSTAEPADDRIDEEILGELLTVFGDGIPAELVNICDLFLTSVPARLGDIDVALAAGHLDEAAHSAHSLKGSTGAFGARRLSVLASRLQEACEEADASAAAPLLAEMSDEFLVFRDVLVARLSQLSA